MATDVNLSCSCGKLTGVIHGASPAHGTRGICYCNDCQAFAHFLQRAPDILNAHGGTDIYQTSPARLEFTQGQQHLACVSLTPKLLRWYADCCCTPVGNTLPRAGIPFVGVIHSFIDTGTAAAEAALGPLRFQVHGRHAKGDTRQLDAHPSAPVSLLWRLGRMLLTARLKGDQKRSPFFDPQTGRPVAEPQILTDGELAEIERARDSFGSAG